MTSTTTSNVSADVDASTTVTKRSRKVTDHNSVLNDLTELMALVDAQSEAVRSKMSDAKSSSAKNAKAQNGVSLKSLRMINSRLKKIHAAASRVYASKQKRPRGTSTPNNGGFCKAHPITREMAEFAGWAPNELKSRVEITKSICTYIRDHKLKDETKPKHIIPDERLAKLLRLKPDSNPLTFVGIQQLIGVLQVKDTSSQSVSVSA